ncbi:MAG: SIS domain-containing protein [FCB group bacterium]|nr:SIS domain-containing protein [FCB group bacterium]
MTELLKDIKNQPDELLRCLDHNLGAGGAALEAAAAILKQVEHIYITGIGSSWHAGMAVLSLFEGAGTPAHLVDASELLHFVRIPYNSAIIALSRSGKSIEIVKLLDVARETDTKIIGITNSHDSPLGKHSSVVLELAAAFDHLVSITMYTGLTLVGGLLAAAYLGTLKPNLIDALRLALSASKSGIINWIDKIDDNPWFARDCPTYFLARGGSTASCYETRLLWEEAAKAPATALTTGVFRHGPQEVMSRELRIGLWIHEKTLRSEDLALAQDLYDSGAKVLLIGKNIESATSDLVLNIPGTPPGWQFLVDIIPAQLCAEYLSHLRGEDCDLFKFCPYVIEKEGGLL